MVTLVVWGCDDNGFWKEYRRVRQDDVDRVLSQYDYDDYDIERD